MSITITLELEQQKHLIGLLKQELTALVTAKNRCQRRQEALASINNVLKPPASVKIGEIASMTVLEQELGSLLKQVSPGFDLDRFTASIS